MKIKVQSMRESKKESIHDFSDVVFYQLGKLQKQGDLSGFSIDTDDSSLASNEMLIKLDNPSEKVNVITALETLKVENEIAGFYQNPDDTIIVTAMTESVKIKKESTEPEYDDTYEDGYQAGKDDYEIGHPMDPEDISMFSRDFQDGYWKGFYDAQEESNEE